MDKKISQGQLMSLGCCYLSGTIVVSVFVSSVAKNESWLIGIAGAICFLPAMLVYFALVKKYPGKGLFQINEAVFGKAFGRLLSGVYLVFLYTLCALNILEASNFLFYFIIPETPLPVIAAVLMLACIYCVKKGFIAIARVSAIFCCVAVAGLLFSTLLSLNDARFEYLFPIFNLRPLDYLQSIHGATAIPYGESLILLLLIPELNGHADIRKVYGGVTVFTACIMTIVHFARSSRSGPYSHTPPCPRLRPFALSTSPTSFRASRACLRCC